MKLPESQPINRLTEGEIDFLERQIPDLAASVGKSAYLEALAAGLKVVCAEAGKLWEISPDGSRRFIKDLGVGMDLPVGTRIEIR